MALTPEAIAFQRSVFYTMHEWVRLTILRDSQGRWGCWVVSWTIVA